MTNPCSIAWLESALAGCLPADDEGALHRHLDECDDCAAALERMAGGSEWCQETASMLSGDELGPISPSREEWSAVDFTVEHLEPADEPNVLGRLGGYDVLEIIGHGGMGVVLKAFDRELKRCVAIKVLAPHLAQSSLAKKRFAREAQAAAAIVHPHVLAIHQVHPHAPLPYLVMSLVAGESLAERLTARGTLELNETLRIGMQAAAGLAAAHEQGLVHRDVKPANILLEKGIERAVLTDFGLARAVDDVTLTRWGIIAGTPQYMSPEQARGEPLDGRSDLFSLGCVLYEMATGVSPFRADSMMATLRRLVDDPPQALETLNPELPPWFIAIVDRLLEKDPARRFDSAKEVSELLEGCLAHVQQPAAAPLPASLVPHTTRSRWIFNSHRNGVVAMLGAVGLSLLGMFLWQSTMPPDISGRWTGEGGGQVVIEEKKPGEYAGAYTDIFGNVRAHNNPPHEKLVTQDCRVCHDGLRMGRIDLKWSRIERRYNGTWSEGEGNDRFGKISVRQVGDEIRGAWTTNRKSEINPGTPELADLLWVRSDSGKQAFSTDYRKTDLLLSTAIATFNERATQDPIGKDQPPLTDDEVLGAIRSLSGIANEQWSANELEQLQSMAEKRILPAGWQFEVVTAIDGADGERFQAWVIQLRTPRADAAKSAHVIRQQLLGQLDASGKPVPLPEVDKSLLDDDATPLAAAIHGFNASYHSVQGVRQKPLAEEEVVAAIRWWKMSRNEAPVTNREFAAFQKIADTRQLPRDAAIDVISHFRHADGSNDFIWSVRIVMPRESKPGWTYAYEIRRQYVRSEGIEAKNSKIAWGAVAPNGLQAGVRLVPLNEAYMTGQQVTPIFYYRNTGKQTLDASFPRLMTHSYYDEIIAVDATGKAIPIEQDQAPSGPVGWVGLPLSPGSLHEIRGLPILIGDGDRGSAETAIRATAGQSVRLRFALPHPEQQDAKPLQTGDVIFSIADVESKATTAVPRRVHHFPTGEKVKTIAYSADGKLIAIANGNPTFPLRHDWKRSVLILDAESGKTVISLPLSTDDEDAVLAATDGIQHFEVNALAFSPDGKVLAVGTGIGQVKLFNARTGELVRSLDDAQAKLAETKTPGTLKGLSARDG